MSKDWKPRTKTERQTTYDIQRRHEQDRRHPPVRLDDPTPEELRSCIVDGHCWWCGRTGFKCLGNHTSLAHGITATDIRDLANLFKYQPTCSPELSFAYRIRNQGYENKGIRAGMVGSAKGHKKQFSRAGREYQDKVKTPLIRAMQPYSQVVQAEMRARGLHVGNPRKPHNCPVCGKLLPTAYPITCSPKCRRIVRQRTARLSSQIRVDRMANDPEYREWIHQICRDGARKRVIAQNA
jgi:hypothetical protein